MNPNTEDVTDEEIWDNAIILTPNETKDITFRYPPFNDEEKTIPPKENAPPCI